MSAFENDGITKLPEEIAPSIVEYVERRSIRSLILNGFMLYCAVVAGATVLQLTCIHLFDSQVVVVNGMFTTQILDLLYFNLVTVLTIGYGDFTPYNWGRLIACAEAIAGVGIFGMVISVAVLKMMLPRRDSIVFSKYCYFTLDDMRFVVVFVNTRPKHLVNSDMCSVLKLGRANWIVHPSYRAPYVGKSAWTFSVNSLLEYIPSKQRPVSWENVREFLSGLTIYKDDGLKFGISGNLGFSMFSASMKYALDQCWVLKTKNELPVDLLRKPQFGSKELENAFHYVPSQGLTFLDWARSYGAAVSEESQ